MTNINMLRIASKLDDLFNNKIDLSDATSSVDEELQKLFYTRSIAALTLMMECGIKHDMAVKNITDGYHDLGIDAIYCDDMQKKLVLVQTKWRQEGKGGIDQEEISSFLHGIKRIINLDFEGANPKIIHKIPEITTAIKDLDYQIVCIFCHTGNQKINNFCMKPINELLATTNDETSDILSFLEFKQADIYKYLASGQDTDNICIDDVILSNWGSLEEPYKAYYGTISAAALGDWYNVYGNKLFAKNIRFYKGSTDVNLGIRKVLQEEPENFFYYNNGVKILCKKIIRKAAFSTSTKTGLFSLEGVSLVNGAQTTGTIGSFFVENPEQTGKATVFVQLIDLAETDETQALQITKLSNTQNRIDSREFAALDPEQDRIKVELSFSNIYYLYKSGAVIEDPDHQVSLEEAIIAQACLQSDVTYAATAKRNIGALTEDIHKAPYKILFNGSTNAFVLKNSIEVLRAVDKYLQIHESEYQSRNRLALVHGNRFILYLVLQKIKSSEDYNIQMIGNVKIIQKVNRLCEIIIPKVIDAMNQRFQDAYPAYIFKNVGRCRELLSVIADSVPEQS